MMTKYLHHGNEVYVDEKLKGRHREHCLCWQGCARFKLDGPRSENCFIANAIFQIDKNFGVTTPVFECPEFEPNTGDC